MSDLALRPTKQPKQKREVQPDLSEKFPGFVRSGFAAALRARLDEVLPGWPELSDYDDLFPLQVVPDGYVMTGPGEMLIIEVVNRSPVTLGKFNALFWIADTLLDEFEFSLAILDRYGNTQWRGSIIDAWYKLPACQAHNWRDDACALLVAAG